MANIPFTKPPDDDEVFAAPPFRRTPQMEKPSSRDESAVYADEDNFTMVNINQLPNLRGQPFDDRPNSSGSVTSRKSVTPRPSPVKHATDGRLNSPAQSRLRSPVVRSPQVPTMRNLDLQTEPEPEPVQVYEDPSTTPEPQAPLEPEKPVLEELPLNERATERTPSEEPGPEEFSQSARSNEQNIGVQRTPRTPRGHYKTTSTGSIVGVNDSPSVLQNNAEAFRGRRLLASGLERIRTKTLEVHGFRKLQELVKSNQDIWGDEGQKFGELLIALLDYLESPNDALKAQAVKATTLKTQVLSTVRAMLTVHKREAAPYYSRALCSVLAARRQFEDTSHISAEIEKTADEIVKTGQPSDCLNAVLDMIESLHAPLSPTSAKSPSESSPPPPDAHDGKPSRTIVLGLSILSDLLATAQAKNIPVSTSQTLRMGSLAVRFLDDTDADVRKADLEFCLSLHEKLGGDKGDGFWRALVGAKEMHLNLLTYYIARRGPAGSRG
jgi:CLIP-associating protein 1/2